MTPQDQHQPEVGLQQDQPHRHQRTQEQRDEAAQVDVALELRQQEGQGADERELGELRRLELERPQPRTRPGRPSTASPRGEITRNSKAVVAP